MLWSLVFVLAASSASAGPSRHARGYVRQPRNEIPEIANITDADRQATPDAVDWSAKGATTPVKDQGDCGSCWAFSTTEGIESATFMATGKLPVLSTQQIISCDGADAGCDGGDLPTALKYVEKAHGIDTSSDYPDKSHRSGKSGKCTWDHKTAAVVTSYKYAVPPCDSGACKKQNENDLASALAKYGPISICLNANDWDDYTRGVYKKKCSSKASMMDHCVQLVGYDKSASPAYWKVRNSWASDWGEEGFIRLPMGENACGLANEAVIISATTATTAEQPERDAPKHAKLWSEFVETFGKHYGNAEEEARRFGIFLKNMDFIEKENAKGLNYTLGMTPFTDLESEEFVEHYMGYKAPNALYGDAPYMGEHLWTGETLPSSVDWTSKGAVTSVKDQGQCGSCWAFSTTGAIESAVQIASGKLVSLSEQELVDCPVTPLLMGCNGGSMGNGFGYAKKRGLCTEASYPYKAKGGSCKKSSCSVGLAENTVTGYKSLAVIPRIVPASENTMMSAVAQQPVSVAIEADKNVFQHYKSGVLSGACGTNLDHGVLVVGYGTASEGSEYWKVKNSWAATWGEDGYVRLKRGASPSECGVLKSPSYPVVSVSSETVV